MKPRIYYLVLFFLVVLPATSGRCYSQSITALPQKSDLQERNCRGGPLCVHYHDMLYRSLS